MNSRSALRAILAVAGIGLVVVGGNVGLGGIRTLGLQVDPGFVQPVDVAAFASQDSHVRFLGGLFTAAGLVYLAGAFLFDRLREALVVLSAMIAFAGLFRLSGGGLSIFSDTSLVGSVLLELVFFPLLAFWIVRSPR